MRRSLAMLMIFSFVLCGCASKYGEQKTTVNYYPACYQPIKDLRVREHDVTKGTAGGAAIGAIGGALLGLLASGGKWQGAAIGAASGAVAGGVMGNIYASKQREADDNRRLASYLEDIDGDISKLDIQSAAARNALQCYNRQFDALISAIKSRSISREAARARYAEIASGREEAIALLGNTANESRNLEQQYEQALVQEEQALNSPRKLNATSAPKRKQNDSQISAARAKKQNMLVKASALDREKEEATMLSSRQNEEINAIMGNLGDIRA